MRTISQVVRYSDPPPKVFCTSVKLFQASLETVRRIATFGKQREYRMNPELLKTFIALKLSEDVGEINPFAPPPKDDDTVCFLPPVALAVIYYSCRNPKQQKINYETRNYTFQKKRKSALKKNVR